MCRILMPVACALTAWASAAAAAQPPQPPQAFQGAEPAAVAAADSSAPHAAPPLTLAAALQQALDSSPQLSAARRELEAAEGARVQAGAYPNPTLSVEVEDVRRDSRTTTAALSQLLELGGKRAARMAAADQAVALARAQLDARQAGLHAGVTAAFFAALVAQERVQLAQASLQLARAGRQAAGQRVLAGKVSPVEETRAQVAQANVQLELLQAQGELQNCLQELRALSAASAGTRVLAGHALALPALPAQKVLEERLAHAPALRQARLQVARLAALARLQSAQRVPDITLSAGVQRAQESGRNQAVLGISVPLPLFDNQRGSVAQALALQYQAEDEARALELRLRADVAAARQRHATAMAEVDALQADILPGAQSAFDAARKGFELGKFDYLQALDAQRTLLQARAQYLRSAGEAHRAATDLSRLLGIPVSPP